MSSEERRVWQVVSIPLVLGLGAAIGALVFFAWLSDEVMEGDTHHFDDVTRAAVHQFASPTLTVAMRDISFLGSTFFLLAFTILVVVCFVLRGWRREAILFSITMCGASLLDITLKHTFQRARPVPFFNIVAPSSYSFPSGHSLASFCFYGALAAILTTRLESLRIRIFLWIGSVILVLLIGLSRIYLGVHYTTDVIAGYAAALIWIVVVAFAEQRLARRRQRKQDVGQ